MFKILLLQTSWILKMDDKQKVNLGILIFISNFNNIDRNSFIIEWICETSLDI